jgi:hypothetical protein
MSGSRPLALPPRWSRFAAAVPAFAENRRRHLKGDSTGMFHGPAKGGAILSRAASIASHRPMNS